MAGVSNILFVECQMALGLTQEQFGELFGHSKRTIQRWQEKGATLLPSQLEALARAVCRVRPDLAVRIAEGAGTSLDALGIDPAQVGPRATEPSPIDAVVIAAADAIGVTPEAVRPALAAAFIRAGQLGLDVDAVARALSEPEKP